MVGVEADVAALDGREAARGEPVHLHEPLVGQHRLDDDTGAPRLRLRHRVLSRFEQITVAFELRHHGLASDVTIHAAKRDRPVVVDLRVQGEDDDQRQVVAHRGAIVVEVVRAGDLDAARAEGHVDHRVGHDGHRAVAERQDDLAPDQMPVARIVGMHGHRAVREHGLGSCGRDRQATQARRVSLAIDDFLRAVDERIDDVPERAFDFLALDLEVGDRGHHHRVPVDETLAAIDEAILVQLDERLDDRAIHPRVHRVVAGLLTFGVGIVPVGRGTEASHLTRDGRARLLLPCAHLRDERIAPEFRTARTPGLELTFDDDLRRDARVIGPDDPVGVEPPHAVIADQHVHQRLLERVTHVQRAGHVGRRQLDAVSVALLVFVRAMTKVTARLPDRIPVRLDRMRLEALGERRRRR